MRIPFPSTGLRFHYFRFSIFALVGIANPVAHPEPEGKRQHQPTETKKNTKKQNQKAPTHIKQRRKVRGLSSGLVLLLDIVYVFSCYRLAFYNRGVTPIRTPGRVSAARREIVIRFFGCPNPESHRVSDLPAPLVGKSPFFARGQILDWVQNKPRARIRTQAALGALKPA